MNKFVLIITALTFFTSCGSATIVPDEYIKIQWAVDNSTTGDIIIVRDGTYIENVNVTVSNLTIRSENGSSLTIIQAANPDYHVFEVATDYVNIHGFSIKGAPDWTGLPCAGIYLINADYCNISDNNASFNNDRGIVLNKSSYNNVVNNYVMNNTIGIFLEFSNHNNITSNNASLNNWDGIRLSKSHNNTIKNNTVLYNSDGILIIRSSNIDLINNSVIANEGDGIHIHTSNNSWIENNTIWNNDAGIILDAYSHNNNITNNNISFSKNDGIYLYYSFYNNIFNNILLNNSNGIKLDFSSNINITKNIINSNIYEGILLYTSNNFNNISYNNLSRNVDGIRLGWFSNENLISENNIDSNKNYGIVFSYSSNNSLWKNIIFNNSWTGIDLYNSNNNTLIQNNISCNGGGIGLFDHCSQNSIISNIVSSSELFGSIVYGIEIQYFSNNNLVYNNKFLNNSNQAFDDGTNTWNFTKKEGTNIIGGPYLGGNYWSDYAGMDTDGDGLGDTSIPYNSSGNISNGGDYLPLTTRTPQTATTDIINDVNALVDDGLNQGQGIKLIKKLEKSITKMDQGNENAASNLLQAFINYVTSFTEKGILSADKGQSLIDSANMIINTLSET